MRIIYIIVTLFTGVAFLKKKLIKTKVTTLWLFKFIKIKFTA